MIPALTWIFSAILVAVFATSVLFTMAYSSNFIYLIGYTNQLLPLFEGIIAGTLFFSFAGSFTGGKKTSLMVAGVATAVILEIVVFAILKVTDYVVPNDLLTVFAFVICSIFLPALQFGQFFWGRSAGLKEKIALPAAVSILSIVVVAYAAIIYEKSGQSNLAEIVSILDYAAIVLLAGAALYTIIGKRSYSVPESTGQ